MNILLASLVALITLAWGWDCYSTDPTGSLPWLARQQGLYLSGLLAVGMMSLAMLLAARPAWLEAPLGGLDRMYRAHKWAGILAVVFASLHWLIEMSDDVLKALVGREGRVLREQVDGLLAALRDLAEDLGEWAIYAVLVMVALALWKRFPYRPWRLLHQAMPVIYLALAFHAVLLAPTGYWSQPVGVLLGLLIAAGVYGSVHSLLGRIGRSRQVKGEVIAIDRPALDIVSVSCQLGVGWRGHRPGQFAFVTLDPQEGPHPFTIASADRGDRTITFQIKALGDYTRRLLVALQAGQAVTVEGPYGRFDLARRNSQARQVWVAGGIGITPFLAWLEALQANPAQAPDADLHYCTRDRQQDPFVERLTTLCAPLPGIRLQVHASSQGEKLTAANLLTGKDQTASAEVWFCGPQGLAEQLQAGLRTTWSGPIRFHQEAFAMR